MKQLNILILFCAILANTFAQPAYIKRPKQDIYVNGMNLAWINFANDLGSGFDQAKFTAIMKNLKANGANSARWWIHVDGTNNPEFINDTVSSMTAADINSLKTALDIAYENGILIDICLWSFDMLQTANTSRTAAVIARNQKMLTDSASTAAYIRNALLPMLNALKGHKGILCWEVFNEPEGMSTQFGWTPTKVDMKDIQRFTNMVAGAIHRNAPGELVSNGSWSFYASTDVPGHKNYYSKAQLVAAGKDTAGYLDFYQVHYYPSNFTIEESPFQYPASHWGLDKPIVIGEFSANGITEKNGTKYTPTEAHQKLYNTGYAGGLTWTYTAHDGNGGITEAGPAMKVIHDNDEYHVEIIREGVNVTPDVKGNLPEKMAYLGSTDTIKINNLDSYFDDEYVAGLTFKVDSQSNIAKYFISGKTLLIAPKTISAGIASVIITATDTGGKSTTAPFIFSLIDTTSANILQFRNAYSSTNESNVHLPSLGVDNIDTTRWASMLTYDNQWYMVKLEKVHKLKRVMINWEAAYAYKYALQVSTDSINWNTLFYESRGDGGFDKIVFNETSAKYLRLNLIKRRTDQNWGFSFFEIGAYNTLTANTAPVIDMPLPDKTVTAKKTTSFYVNTMARDADQGDRFTYSVKLAGGNPIPDFLIFTDSLIQFKGTPAERDTGKYNIVVTVTDMGGAQLSDTFQLVVKSSVKTDISTTDQAPVISAYPVPANNYLNVKFNVMPVGVVDISIVDYSGRIILMERLSHLTESTYLVNLKNLKPGNYILKVSSGNINKSVPVQIVR